MEYLLRTSSKAGLSTTRAKVQHPALEVSPAQERQPEGRETLKLASVSKNNDLNMPAFQTWACVEG